MIKKIKTDMHTHTIASGDSYSTLLENIKAAKKNGIEAIAITEHGPATHGSANPRYFMNYKTIPRIIDDVLVFCGVELNVINFQGEVDLSNNMLSRLDFVLAGFHTNIIKPGTLNEHTEAWLNVIDNPYIDCLAHPGRNDYEFDLPTILDACKDHNVAIEVNSKSLGKYANRPRCEDIIEGCKLRGVPIMINSGAHFAYHIGQNQNAIDFLNSLDFPEELIINRNVDSLVVWLANRKLWKSDLQELAENCQKRVKVAK
ncbi:MAG: phosphatase [Clostridiaceae bacterium]|nr:phosphatase [Clostridiaceae bacterium]